MPVDPRSVSCPISTDLFKDPVFIPECGHTFDRAELINSAVRKCPLCNVYFKGDPAKFRVNWVVAEILGLNIPRPTAEDFANYDAMMARADSNKVITDRAIKLLAKLLHDIKAHAKATGVRSYTFETGDISEDIIKQTIIELRLRGYTVSEYYKSIGIFWN